MKLKKKSKILKKKDFQVIKKQKYKMNLYCIKYLINAYKKQ